MAMSGSIEKLTSKEPYNIEIYSFSNGAFSETQNTIKFPAFITAFTDGFKSDWKTETVLGKMDPISTFKNTSRVISLAFDVPNDSVETAASNMDQIDFLIRGLYPIYSQGSLGTRTLASPPMFRVKFGNLISNPATNTAGDTLKTGLLCYIGNFDFAPKVDSGFFIKDEKVILPKLISVSLNLNIIHEHVLGNETIEGKQFPRINFGAFPHGYSEEKTRPEVKKPATPSAKTQTTIKHSEAKAGENAVLAPAKREILPDLSNPSDFLKPR